MKIKCTGGSASSVEIWKYIFSSRTVKSVKEISISVEEESAPRFSLKKCGFEPEFRKIIIFNNYLL